MRYRARKPKWPWRNYLTADERKVLAAADAAKRKWQKLNKGRAAITNRAIQRAKYAAQIAGGNDRMLNQEDRDTLTVMQLFDDAFLIAPTAGRARHLLSLVDRGYARLCGSRCFVTEAGRRALQAEQGGGGTGPY